MRKTTLLPLAALFFLPFLGPAVVRRRPASSDAAAVLERGLAASMPADTLLYVEAPGLAPLCAQGLEHPLVRAVLGSELGRLLLAQAPGSPEELLAKADRAAGMPVLSTLASLGSRGVALGVVFREEQPAWLFAMRGDDAERWREALEQALALAAEKAGYPGALDEPALTIEGAEVWRAGDELVLALRGASYLASNDEALLREALALAHAEEEAGLARVEGFRGPSGERRTNELAWAWTDLEGLAAIEGRAGPEHERKLEKLRAVVQSPPAQFLFGPGLSALGRARTWTASLWLQGEDLDFALRADGVDAGAAAILSPRSAASPFPSVSIASGAVASAVLYRDLGALFARRAELFPPDTLPGFAKAASDLALIFGGMDLGEEMLPRLAPWMHVVARPIAFGEGVEPEIPLPAAALVVELEDPETLGPELVSAFQTAIGLVNVDRAQKAQDSLLLEVKEIDGMQVTSARFKKPRAGEGVDLRYNFVPACAVAGRSFVLGTHVKLVAELARESLAAETSDAGDRPRAPGTPKEQLELSGPALAVVFAANAEAMVMNAVLNEGKSREQAEGELAGLIALLHLVRSARASLTYPDAGRIDLTASLDVEPKRE